MSVPQCTHWRGHMFEARYSTKLPREKIEMTGGNIRALEAIKDKIYERDICVRCGHVIERKP